MNRVRLISLFALGLAILAATPGCSTVASRIQRNPGVYAALPVADQTLVLQGEIREGMTPDAVFLAWGRADSVRRSEAEGRRYETWIYNGYRTEQIPAWRSFPVYPRGAYGGPYAYVTDYDPIIVSTPYPLKSATFQKGRVAAWSAPAGR